MSLQGGTSEKLAKMGSLTTKERSNKAENLTKYMSASARLVAFYLSVIINISLLVSTCNDPLRLEKTLTHHLQQHPQPQRQ
jgi:hypothetical protein